MNLVSAHSLPAGMLQNSEISQPDTRACGNQETCSEQKADHSHGQILMRSMLDKPRNMDCHMQGQPEATG